MKQHLLFISHRIPAPPNKGDKIRSYNFIRNLSRKYTIHLAFLIDDESDIQHVEMLQQYAANIFWERISPRKKKIASAIQAVTGSQPITLPYFYSNGLQQKIDVFLDSQDVDMVFCFSSPTAEYIYKSKHVHGRLKSSRWVMDFIDVDSYKWKQYAENCRFPLSWVYGREARLLQHYERRIARDFHTTLLVSGSEVRLFQSFCSEVQVKAVPNGVDLEHFAPGKGNVVTCKAPVLVFTGAMDYWPNIDGVTWFVHDIFPHIRSEFPDVEFLIVGSYPTPEVQKLQEIEGVRVMGFVDDIRDYIASADVCVVPLRIARGIQNKVLEAMAMGKPVVCSEEALEGIEAEPGKDLLSASKGITFAAEVVKLLGDTVLREQLSSNARSCVIEKYTWEKSREQLEKAIHVKGTSG